MSIIGSGTTQTQAFTSDMQTASFQLGVGLFGISLGTAFLNELATYMTQTSGATVSNLYQVVLASSVGQSASYYPNYLTNTQFADRLATNLLGSKGSLVADAAWQAGSDWVAAQLNSGMSRAAVAKLATEAVAGVSSSDTNYGKAAAAFDNKVTVSEYYTLTVGGSSTSVTALAAVLTNVNDTTNVSTPAAVAAVIDESPAGTSTGQSFSLTTGVNSGSSFTGGTGADSFDGSLSSSNQTLGSSDVLNGAGGTDSLSATLTGGTTTPTLTAIENLTFTATGTATVDLSKATGVTSIENSSSASALTVNNVASATTALAVNSASSTTTIKYTDAALAGSSDNIAIAMSSNTGDVVLNDGGGSNKAETVTITSSGSASSFTNLTTTNVETSKLVVKGDADLTVTAALGVKVATIDASLATGSVTLTTGAVTTPMVIQGGSGNDGFTLAGTSTDSVVAGAGNDTVTIGEAVFAATDTIAGGEGTDTLLLNEGDAGAGTYTVADALFTNVTSVEKLKVGAEAAADVYAITLSEKAKAAGIVEIVDGVSEGDTDVTIDANYNLTTVTFNIDDTSGSEDTITAAGTTATVIMKGKAGAFTNDDDFTGGSGTSDEIVLTNTGSGTNNNTSMGLEKVTVTATDGNVTFAMTGADLTTGSTALTVDASAMTSTAYGLSFAAASATDNLVITGSAGNDTITAGQGNDSITLGTGTNSAKFGSGYFTSADSVTGGAGNDTVAITDAATVIDSDFTKVTSVENLSLEAAGTSVALGALAKAAGIVRVVAADDAIVAFDSSYTTGDTVTFEAAAADKAETITMAAAATLKVKIDLDNIDTDTLTASTGTSDELIVTSGTVSSVNIANVTGFEKITTSGDAGAFSITLNEANIASGKTLVVNAATLVTTNALTLDASNEAGGGAVSVVAGAGDDLLTASAGADYFSGAAGNDTFTFAAARLTTADTIVGGDGNADTIATSDTSTAAAVDADFTNVTGVEKLSLFAGSTGATISTAAKAAGIATVVLSTGTNGLTVGTGFDATALEVQFSSGVDTVTATGTSAVLTMKGSASNIVSTDTWTGGSGSSDTLKLTTGTVTAANIAGITKFENITTSGDGGNFSFTLAEGTAASGSTFTVNAASLVTTNTLTLDASNDSDATFVVTGGSSNDTITGGALNDTISGGAGNDVIDGGLGADSMVGGLGNDTIYANASGDVAEAGDGTDTLLISSSSSSAFVVDLSASADQLTTYAGAANSGVQSGFEILDGSGLLGTLTATAVSTGSSITGGNGADTLNGGTGADSLTGGAGNDSITAGGGQDTLKGGTGNDTYNLAFESGAMAGTIDDVGASTADKIVVTGAITAAKVFDFTATDGTTGGLTLTTANVFETIDLAGITGAGVTVTAGNADGSVTTVSLTEQADKFTGSTDAFLVYAGGSADTVTGGDGADTINGQDGADVLTGGNEADTINGGNGGDFIKGDTSGDQDIDVLVGGAGNDTYAISDADEVDTITDIAGEGTLDTLFFAAGLDLKTEASNVSVNGATDLGGVSGGGAGIEQIVITAGQAVTLDSDHLTANYINVTDTGAAATTLKVLGDDAVADTINLSNLTFTASTYVDANGATTATTAWDAATDILYVDGGTSADNITLASVATRVGISGIASTDTITGFTSATDKLYVATALVANGGGDTDTLVTATSTAFKATATTIGATTGFVFISDSVGVAGSCDEASEVVTFLDGAGGTGNQTNMASGDIVFVAVRDAADTYIWSWTDSGTNTATIDAAELALVAKLVGVTALADGDFVQY